MANTPLIEGSILTDVKKLLGIAEEYEVFDPDILMYINSALVSLNQSGDGRETPFRVEDKNNKWSEITTEPFVDMIKTYLWARVKTYFDPPPTSYAATALNEQIREMEWRLNVASDGRIYAS